MTRIRCFMANSKQRYAGTFDARSFSWLGSEMSSTN